MSSGKIPKVFGGISSSSENLESTRVACCSLNKRLKPMYEFECAKNWNLKRDWENSPGELKYGQERVFAYASRSETVRALYTGS